MPSILIWLPKHGNIGHMSLRVNSDLYISFWPHEECGPLSGFVASHGSTYERDCFEEGYDDDDGDRVSRGPDTVIDVNFTLCASDIRSWWDDFESCGYNLLLRNCCDAVEKAIQTGMNSWVALPKFLWLKYLIGVTRNILFAVGAATSGGKSKKGKR